MARVRLGPGVARCEPNQSASVERVPPRPAAELARDSNPQQSEIRRSPCKQERGAPVRDRRSYRICGCIAVRRIVPIVWVPGAPRLRLSGCCGREEAASRAL